MNDPATTPEMKLTILQDGAYAYSGMGLDEFEITEMTAGNSKTLSSDIREHCEYLEMKLKENFRKDTKAETNAQIARLAKLGYDVSGLVNWVGKERHALAVAAEERRLEESVEAKKNLNNYTMSLEQLNRMGRAESNKQAKEREKGKFKKFNDWLNENTLLGVTGFNTHGGHCNTTATYLDVANVLNTDLSVEKAEEMYKAERNGTAGGYIIGGAAVGAAVTAPFWVPAVTTGVTTTASTTAAVVSKYYKEISSTVKYSANQVAVAGNYVMNSMRQIKPEYIKNGLKGIRTGFGKGGQLYNTALRYNPSTLKFSQKGVKGFMAMDKIPPLNKVFQPVVDKGITNLIQYGNPIINAVNGAIEGYAGSTPYPDWGSFNTSIPYAITWTAVTLNSNFNYISNSITSASQDIRDIYYQYKNRNVKR